MQERDRARLQKMGTSGVETDTLLQCRKKRLWFTLPSFNRRSSAGERQELARSEQKMAKTAEEAARVKKAAAWQWYTRGVGEAVVPTKRPSVGKSLPSQAPILVHGRAASRFKAEARFARHTRSAAAPAPSPGPSTPLYDEFELSGLRTQMADFVQRLQLHQQTKGNQQFPLQNSKPPHTAAVYGRPLPAAASHHQHIKAPPTAAAFISASDHQLTKPAAPFHMRPFSALHKLFRKVVPPSTIKGTNNSPLTSSSSPAVYIEPEVLSEEKEEHPQSHYHHYIHHHHHHYHYSESHEERAAIISSRRRHSESSDIRPNPWEAEYIEDEEEDERRSPIEAYLARRRRHSHTFAARLTPKKAAFDEEEEMKEQSAKAASPLQMRKRHNSERFSPNKCSAMDNKDLAQPAGGSRDEYFLEIRSKRHSADYNQEALGEYNQEALGGVKNGGGIYKLSGAGDGAMRAKPLVWRRHSEGLQRPEGVHCQMGKSPLARYLENMVERQIGAFGRDLAPTSLVKIPDYSNNPEI